MRPSKILILVLGALSLAVLSLGFEAGRIRAEFMASRQLLDIAASGLGLSDLCVATEARYTRHPAASDRLVPFMSHPGAVEHFPTGSFWAPPPHLHR